MAAGGAVGIKDVATFVVVLPSPPTAIDDIWYPPTTEDDDDDDDDDDDEGEGGGIAYDVNIMSGTVPWRWRCNAWCQGGKPTREKCVG